MRLPDQLGKNCLFFPLLILLLSCGHDRALTQITITPSSVTFLTPQTGLTVQLTAIGTFMHPPGTADITNKVTWKSNAPQLVAITSSGVVSPAGLGACGTAGILATAPVNSNNSSLIIAQASVTVDDPTNPICPQ